MEDVLDVYHLPYDKKTPVICMDEKPYQLLDECRQPIPMTPGNPKLIDSEYKRNGTCSIFVFTEPLAGWRRVSVRERRTKIDWANEVRKLLEIDYPKAEKIILVMDNLNTHKTSSFYEAFEPELANKLSKRIEIHYTPKHGSWLNIAEIELSAMTRQCLGRRIPDIELLANELTIWNKQRNNICKSVNWQFSTDEARIKLKHVYPTYL